MGTQTDYFERIGYKPKYFLGDRVCGIYNKVPYVGTVGNDRVIDNTGPQVLIHLDLPILVDKILKSLIIVKHKDVRRLPELNLDPQKDPDAKTSKPKRVQRKVL